ncbi:putative CAP superfamily protein [Helianthus annuus]|nr:putative CAP superfamily protein [Helianthus annuus]
MTVAAYARGYAYHRLGDCDMEHSQGPFGENLAEGYGDQFTATDAVNMWVGEKQYYEYGSNSCVDECRHYTQVVCVIPFILVVLKLSVVTVGGLLYVVTILQGIMRATPLLIILDAPPIWIDDLIYRHWFIIIFVFVNLVV